MPNEILLCGFVAAAICVAPLPAQPLRDLAGQRGIHIGAAAEPARLTESAYAGTLSREFSAVTPENVMKFGPIHPGRSTYNFAPADALVSFARDNNMAVRGHTLVWHSQNAAWLTAGNFSPEQLASILEEHITTVAGHFAGQLYAWDVVNEAFNDNGAIRGTIWSNAPGIGLPDLGYVEQAFRWAHAADPRALLFYNDYSIEGTNAKSNSVYEMAKDFVERGVPIDGIGLQMHWTTSTATLSSIEANIKRITDLGLMVHVTELDVRLPLESSGFPPAESIARQAQIYQDMVAICLKFPLCTSIATWGFTDRYSWVPGAFPGTGAALPFDGDYQPKPAYDAMVNALQSSPPVILSDGFANAASFAKGAVAPGEVIVLNGATFGPVATEVAQSETRLLFDAVAAPILSTRVGLTIAVVPFAVAGSLTTRVEYEYKGIRSAPVSLEVAATSPGVFTLDNSGRGAAANPTRRGDVITLIVTGGGVTDPPSVDGQIATEGPLPIPAAPVSVTIGGVECTVQSATAAPGQVAGMLRIDVLVADEVASGDQPVLVTIGGASSQAGAIVRVL